MDTALVDGGVIIQVWRNQIAEGLPVPPSGTLVEFNPAEDGLPICGMLWDGTTLSNPPAAAPSVDAVHAERDRRMAVFSYNGKDYDFDPDSRQNISGATALAIAAIMGGAQVGNYLWHGGATNFVWMAQDNTLTQMDAHDVLAFGQAAAAWKSALIFAARAIKDIDPIPADFATNESYWPQPS